MSTYQPHKPQLTAYLTLTPDMKKRFRSKLRNCNVRIIESALSKDTLHTDTEILAVFVDSKVTKADIDAMPKLQLIVTLSTGFDHIALAAAKKRGIPVCNVPSYGESTVAEYALSLMLSLTRNMFPAVKRVKEGNFEYAGLRGSDIAGKTIGIIGTGRIGRHLIQLLGGFDATLIGYDPYPDETLRTSQTFQYVSLGELLKTSDIISLHAPLTEETAYIIDKKAIKQMKPGVIIVNTARGGLIHSEALLWGLGQNIIAGAGLDVLESENLLEDPCMFAEQTCTMQDVKTTLMNEKLIDHPRTIVTPHNAFNTTEAVTRIIDTSVENIRAFQKGTPIHTITL